MIDPASDSIVLIDFNVAYRAGIRKLGGRRRAGKWGERDDVKGVLVFLYEYVTRDPTLAQYWPHLVEEATLKNPAKWIKHPDAELDHDVADFYFELIAWVRNRRAEKPIVHWAEAPEPIDWPDLPAEAKHGMTEDTLDGQREAGVHLDWKRPRTSKIDSARRLLDGMPTRRTQRRRRKH